VSWLLDFLFPKKCVGCGKYGQYVCSSCQIGLWEEEQICPVCGFRSEFGATHIRCQKTGSLDGLSCFWAHQGIAHKLFKKADCFYDYLNELIASSLKIIDRPEFSQLLEFVANRPTVVPVPPRLTKDPSRSETIAHHLAKLFNLPKTSLSQIQMTRKSPTFVLLVDGVWRPRKDLEECSQMLKKTGVRNVWGLVLAR
jgi:predicted amidophosphoribosyltransferase